MTDDAGPRRARNLELATRTFEALSRLDVDGVAAGLHPELVFELPYEKVVPLLDRAGFVELLHGLRRTFESFSVTVIETVPGEDPDTVVLRYRGDARSADGQVSYRNDYLGMLYFADGLIRHWREYANPVLTRRMNERLAAVATS
jgi:ketosteroid isomerase-like protein